MHLAVFLPSKTNKMFQLDFLGHGTSIKPLLLDVSTGP